MGLSADPMNVRGCGLRPDLAIAAAKGPGSTPVLSRTNGASRPLPSDDKRNFVRSEALICKFGRSGRKSARSGARLTTVSRGQPVEIAAAPGAGS